MIFILLGKSSVGKDSIYNEIMKENKLNLEKIIPYTTRPMRENEKEGREYHFVSEEEYLKIKEKGIIIEERSYNTVNGLWRYFTVDKNISKDKNYITIGTLESINSMYNYFHDKNIVLLPIYIYIKDNERLKRAIKREENQKNPNYKELCRRFIADEDDFSEENFNKYLPGIPCIKFENKKSIEESSSIILSLIDLCINNKNYMVPSYKEYILDTDISLEKGKPLFKSNNKIIGILGEGN